MEARPPDRTCAKCGGIAIAQSHTQWKTTFSTTASTTYHYRCQGCGRAFSTEPLATLLRNVGGGVLLIVLAVMLAHRPDPKHKDEVLTWVFGAGGVVALLYSAWRWWLAAQNRVRDA